MTEVMDHDTDTAMFDDDQGGVDSSTDPSPPSIAEKEQDTFKSTVTVVEEDDSDQELYTVKVIEFETEVKTERKSINVKKFNATVHALRFTPQVSEEIMNKMFYGDFIQSLFENLIKYLSNRYKQSDNDFVGCKFFFAVSDDMFSTTNSSQEIRRLSNNDDDAYPVWLPYMPWNKLSVESILEMTEQTAQSDRTFDCLQSFVLELSLIKRQ
jgi:hypothetical protein